MQDPALQALRALLHPWTSWSATDPWFFTAFSFLGAFGVLLLCLPLFHGQRRLRQAYIVAFSAYFYYRSSGPFLLLFLLVVVSDFLFAHAIARQKGTRRTWLLAIAIAFSASFLIWFKYAAFLAGNLNSLLGTNLQVGDLFLPIGISFYTFQSIGYLVDVHKRNVEPSRDLLDYTFYMTFFPHLVAGPIVRARDFLPQLQRPLAPGRALMAEALTRIATGLAKKLLLADHLGRYVDLVHAGPAGFSGGENLLAIYAYSFQIYFDFSGYSDIAIGMALLLGYRLCENFRVPYTASDITRFWRSWHISLSDWLRDHIYIPLGGNRRGPWLAMLFVLATMLFGGLWHGADWRFVTWGGLHGLALVVHKAWARTTLQRPRTRMHPAIGAFITFHFVAGCWVFFRATSFGTAFDSLRQVALHTRFADLQGSWEARPELLLLLLASALLVFLPAAIRERAFLQVRRMPLALWPLVLLVLLQLVVQFQDHRVQPFIYFQF
jgi:D-alanyl-lipoteichoic acid acyltransferase DltB (MBOAT superfamily)